MRGLFKLHPIRTLLCSVDIESARADAMNPVNVAYHLTRLRALMDKFNIRDPS